MRRYAFVVTLLLFAIAYSSASRALPIVETAPCSNDPSVNCATGITGLDILGSIFDVSFHQGPFSEVIATTPHAFIGNPNLAYVAAYFLAAQLTAASDNIRGVIGTPSGPPWSDLLIAHDYNSIDVHSKFVIYKVDPNLVQFLAYTSDSVTTTTDGDYYNSSHRTFDAYALFTTPVPSPHSLPLIGLGLVGLWATRRKRPTAARSAGI